MSELVLRNRQRLQRVDARLLKLVTRTLLEELRPSPGYNLGIHLVAPGEMALVNETFLQHTGSTDVITFDHRENDTETLHGELYICVGDAVSQAREFGTTWQQELVRYVVHGVLHLQGYDDLMPAKRRIMKREENRLVRQLQVRFPLSKISKARTVAP